ncbi:MAG TPA: 1-acyl-sn-glycerol-3-phosphate acyltransferase [bacterium]|nr:1-acyl-sn-glycerol-3-phosphate acyltransferase [bacterium]
MISFIAYGGGFFVLTLLFPVLLPAVALLDLIFRRQWKMTRLALFFEYYLAMEMAGLQACLGIWLRHKMRNDIERYRTANYRLMRWWARSLLGVLRRLYRLRFTVEGDRISSGPFIAFMRHVSWLDNLVAAAAFVVPHDLHLRQILKDDLQWDPCLDVLANRLDHVFVKRESIIVDTERVEIVRMMTGLRARNAVVFFPEGEPFRPEKRDLILSRLATTKDLHYREKIEALKNVLPPRFDRSLLILDKNKNADVVFCAHYGFEHVLSVRDFFAGALINRTIRVRTWRVPHAEIPHDDADQVKWMFNQWARVDRWLEQVKNKNE